MKIAVPLDRTPDEPRAAIGPDAVKAYVKKGHAVTVEAGVGKGAFMTDEAYREAGADLAKGAAVGEADVVLTVRRPSDAVVKALKPGAGLDVLLKYDYKKFYVWATYSLGYVTHDDGERTYPPHYDRRPNTNVVVSYSFGKKPVWEASARWNYGSGFPFTPPAALIGPGSRRPVQQWHRWTRPSPPAGTRAGARGWVRQAPGQAGRRSRRARVGTVPSRPCARWRRPPYDHNGAAMIGSLRGALLDRYVLARARAQLGLDQVEIAPGLVSQRLLVGVRIRF